LAITDIENLPKLIPMQLSQFRLLFIIVIRDKRRGSRPSGPSG